MGMAALLPAAKLGAGAIGSWLGSKLNKNPVAGGQLAQPSAQDYSRSPAGQSVYNKLVGGADQQMAGAQPLAAGVGNYYRSLISGNKAAVNAAVAPDRAALAETYKGAEAGARRLRGPARDRALSNLSLQKTGQLGLLPFAARQRAVGEGGAFAQNQQQLATSVYDRALGSEDRRKEFGVADTRAREGLQLQGAQLNEQAKERQRQAGGAFGNFFYDLISGIGGKGRGGGMVNGFPLTGFQPSVPMVRP